MKKLIYSLAMAVLALSSCTKFDKAITENYGDGPSIEVSIAAVEPTDSAFVVTITPGEGTTYYAFVLDASDEAEELDASTLLKGGYGNDVVNTNEYPTLTIPYTEMEPNTTYQVYAVASNDKGIVGQIAVASIKTTDSGKPNILASAVDAAGKKAAVAFDQAISRGDGKVTAVFYKEYDFENPVQSENVDVQISGKVTQLTAVDAPAGAFVLFSWEEGAFVDATGNACSAFTSSVNPEGETISDIFKGLWFRVPTTTWAISDSQFTSPKVGGTFPKWSEFEGVIEFAEKVYVVEDEVKDGDFVVTYTNNSRSISYKLPKANINFGVAEDLSTQKVTFSLPAATNAGDKVTVSIAEGVFYDVLGNGNAAYASEKVFWTSFAMTPEMALGTFDLLYISYYDETGTVESLGNVTIESDPEVANGIIIKDLYLEGSAIKGSIDLDECKIYIPDSQVLGTYTNSKGTTYGLLFVTADGTDAAAFSVNADGTMVADGMWGVYALDETFSTELGWFDVAKASMFSPVKATASAKKAMKILAKTKTVKKTTRNLNKRVSK